LNPRSEETTQPLELAGAADTDGDVAARLPAFDTGAPHKGSTFESLKNRDFRWLWVGTTSGGFSQWGQQIGLNWLVYQLTGSAVQLGAVTFAGGILALALGPFSGLLSDRYPRRAILIATNSIGAVQAGILAVLVLTDTVQLWHAYAFAIISSITATANNPAQQAYVNDVATPETLTNAIALNSLGQNIARILGPPLTGAIVAVNVGAAFVMVAATRSLSAFSAMALAPRRQAAVVHRNPLREVGAGFRYLAGEQRLLLLLSMNALASLFVIPYLSFMPIFAREVFHGGPREYGWIVSMLAVGSIVGLLALAWVGDLKHKGRYLIGGQLMYLVLVIAFTRTHILLLALTCLAVAGLFRSVANVLNTTFFQISVRPEMRGRGIAAFNMGSGLTPIGALVMGFLVARFGVQDGVMLSQSMALTGMLLIAIFGRSIRSS
jgi:MFS family permease